MRKKEIVAVVVQIPRTLIYNAERCGFGGDETGKMRHPEAVNDVTYQPIWKRLVS